MRKLLLGFLVVALISAVFYLRFHRAKTLPLGAVYAGSRQVILWSSMAQIRNPVTSVNFGDHLDVLNRYGDEVQVRTSSGIVGWASAGDVLSAEIWQKVEELDERTKTLPVEANGHTRVISNLHLAPGRETLRIRQLSKAVAVDLFERQPIAVPASKAAPPSSQGGDGVEAPPQETPEPRKEDWWLVRANLPDKTSESGWVLGRFVDLDIPAPLPDYASAAGMHIAAWFELNRAPDSSGAAKAQYLVVGNRGSEGQACDFTLLRVFTWSVQRQRYETAFVESDVCGKLPVTLSTPKGVGGDVTFTFQDWSGGAPETRLYRMHQTIVRRVRQVGGLPSGRRKR
jgi:hypothetical protein